MHRRRLTQKSTKRPTNGQRLPRKSTTNRFKSQQTPEVKNKKIKNFQFSESEISESSNSYSNFSSSENSYSDSENSYSDSQDDEEEIEIEIKVEDLCQNSQKITPSRFETDVYSRLMGHQLKKQKKIAKMKIEVKKNF